MQSAFIAIYCESNFYKNYEQISEDKKSYILPLVIMLNRWDGKIGFIGGHVDDGETVLDCIIRETKEEIGFSISDNLQKNITFICSKQMNDLTTHLYALKVNEDIFRTILSEQHKSMHFLAEGTATAIHFVNYPHNKSFDNFMQNNFAPTVKEEIYDFVKKLGWIEKYHLSLT